ncbi:MAG TPA: caspase family protein [Vicinamibacterales bacterium]|nr:caspase family protein [Vicinamibacterales bacterium]
MTRLLFVLLSSAVLSASFLSMASGQQTSGGRDLLLDKTKPKSGEAGAVPRGYALIVGIARYQNLDASRQLQFPETDAEAMYRVLINHEGGAFPPENVHFLKGNQATLANVRRELEEWLPTVAQPADRVVVYFAGHGFVKESRGYLAPWDVDPDNLEQTAYPMAALGEVLANRVKAGWKVLLTDACHSGKINAETTNEALEEQFNALPQNFLTLTATTEREQSFEDPNLSTGFGFFTYFVVQAFGGYADNDPCDGRITADELIEYVRSNVRRYARDRQLSQTPTARGDYEPEMLLGVGRGCLDGGARAPSMLGTAIVETNLEDVELYVDEALIGKLSKSKPLVVPSLSSGLHVFKGVKAGYEPDRKEVMIAPGQQATVTLRIRYVRQVKKPAIELNEQGEKLLFTRRSPASVTNVVPVTRRQSDTDLKKAATLFERALAADASFALAAHHLGQVHHLLLNHEESLRFYRRAVELDASDVDSRIACAAVLVEQGDADQAIRELMEVLRLDPSNDEAYSMASRAYWDKGAWTQAIEQADNAIAINPANAQAHLWKADARRQLAAAERDAARQRQLYADAREDYRAFLNLTNFSTPVHEWLAFHFIGLGVGSRRHADRQGAYDSLRSSGFMGLCLSEQKVGNPLRAREYCERALQHAPRDPIAYFLLGNVNRDLYNGRQSCEYLTAARASYAKMIAINGELDESKNARNYLTQIEAVMPKLGCRGR